ncbi:uncharacterized protein LOC110261360 [Sus scrofa]|uniref:uncharacterized protein LOC110261360 n=1 Tax=Sus scrofa TaxID=9823 RepID=UPI000A2B8CAD|nr:uncharacterized protein LOC110261360 [Sus scrofa]
MRNDNGPTARARVGAERPWARKLLRVCRRARPLFQKPAAARASAGGAGEIHFHLGSRRSRPGKRLRPPRRARLESGFRRKEKPGTRTFCGRRGSIGGPGAPDALTPDPESWGRPRIRLRRSLANSFPNLCSQSGEAAWRGRAVGPGNLEFRGPPDAGCTYDWESATRQELRCLLRPDPQLLLLQESTAPIQTWAWGFSLSTRPVACCHLHSGLCPAHAGP